MQLLKHDVVVLYELCGEADLLKDNSLHVHVNAFADKILGSAVRSFTTSFLYTVGRKNQNRELIHCVL